MGAEKELLADHLMLSAAFIGQLWYLPLCDLMNFFSLAINAGDRAAKGSHVCVWSMSDQSSIVVVKVEIAENLKLHMVQL